MSEEIYISKLDAARRQLLAAIHLHWYFNEPIAVYSLAANVWEICDALLQRQNKIRILEEITATHGTTPRAIRDLINAPRNFVKHADRNPDEEIEDITPADCDAVVMTACLDYMFANGRSPYCARLFLGWYSAVYPKKTESFFRDVATALFLGLASLTRDGQKMAARKALKNPPNEVLRDMRNELTDNYRWCELREVYSDLHRPTLRFP